MDIVRLANANGPSGAAHKLPDRPAADNPHLVGHDGDRNNDEAAAWARSDPRLIHYLDASNRYGHLPDEEQQPYYEARLRQQGHLVDQDDDLLTGVRTHTLRVTNLPLGLNQDGIRNIFSRHGRVINVEFRGTSGSGPAWATVTYGTHLEAMTAKQRLDQSEPFNLHVFYYRPPQQQQQQQNRLLQQHPMVQMAERMQLPEADRMEENIDRRNQVVPDVAADSGAVQVYRAEDELQPRSFGNPLLVNQSQPLLACSYRPCGIRGRLRCSRCKAWYCSQHCQVEDWQTHRLVCQEPPPLEYPDGTLVRGARPLRRPNMAPVPAPASMPLAAPVPTPYAVTEATHPVMTPTTITSAAVRAAEPPAATPAPLKEKVEDSKAPATQTNTKEKQQEAAKKAEAASASTNTNTNKEPVKKVEVKKDNKIPVAAPAKAKPEVKTDKIPVAAAAAKPVEQKPTPQKAQTAPKAEEKAKEPKVEPKANSVPAKTTEASPTKAKPAQASPAPAKPAQASPAPAKLEEKPAAKEPEPEEAESILDDPNSRCIVDLVDEGECDAAIVAEVSDPDGKFSPGDMACLVSYEELGVDYVLEAMQEAWKAKYKVEKPVSSTKAGEFVIFSKVVPDEGTVFVRGFVLAVNPKGDRINAMDIDSGFCKKVDMANVYKMRPEDKEYPGLGCRMTEAKPLDTKQQEAVEQTLQESFSPPVKLARNKDGSIQATLALVDGAKVPYKLIPWYQVDERIVKMLSDNAPGPAPAPVQEKSEAEKKKEEEEAKKAAIQKEFEAKMKELEALKAKMTA